MKPLARIILVSSLALAAGCAPQNAASAAARPEKWAAPMTLAGVPNLHKVADGLYRSAQPTAEGMTNLVSLGIKTIVNLRDNHSDSDEIGALPLAARRIEIFTANMKDKYVDEFLSIVDDTNAAPPARRGPHGDDVCDVPHPAPGLDAGRCDRRNEKRRIRLPLRLGQPPAFHPQFRQEA